MLLKKKTEIFALILFIFSFSAFGQQDRYSLEELIDLTLQENYQLQIMRKQQQMAENLNTPGNAGMLPMVGIGSERSWEIQTSEANLFTGETRSGDNALSTLFNAMVEVDWMVFDGFSMFARRDRLGYLAQMSDLETRFFIEQTVSDLAKTYYSLVREKRLLETLEQFKEVSAYRLELEERKRAVGSGSALLYHQAVVDYNSDSALVVDQEMNMRDQEIQINRLINRNPRLALQPQSDAIDLQGIAPDGELIEMAEKNNRDLERAKLKEMLTEANYRIEKGERYPQVSLFGNYAFSHQTSELGIIESSQSRGAQFGIRVRFNLYDGGRQNTRIENVVLEKESADIYQKDTRVFIESELVRLISRYEAFLQQYRLLQESVEAADRSLSIAREQLQTGAINGYEFRQTQLAALQVENQLIDLKYAMRIIEIDVYRLSGELMERLL